MIISQPLEAKRVALDTCIKAEEWSLLDRAAICLNERTYVDFLERLDAPPRLNARLQKTMQATAPWDAA